MIIKEFEIEKIIKEKKRLIFFLIYGPNEGLIRDHINRVTSSYINKQEYEIINFNCKELDTDPQKLNDIIKTVSMFYKNKLLIIEELKDKHIKIIEDIIGNPQGNDICIIKSNNLSKSSKIRKLFENDKSCFSLACYEDDNRSLMKSIDSFIQQNQINMDRETKNYLLQSLSNDRMISKNELEKILLFNNNSGEKIELDELKKLLNDTSSINLNKMNENVMYGNTLKSSKIIHKLLSEGSSPITLLRSLTNYTLIQETKIEMKKGNSFDVAIKILKPPVFWKDKDSFQKHCLKWPIRNIEKVLSSLLEAEIFCKLNSKLAVTNCEKSILLIANNGKQYFKN